ncbi:hypothetical protein BAnh1_02700 [Bartonella australis AUST/NH1]|uniref:Uncharacterized protein n=1 Tax=Bartonella australis (strain Aust/NH1) TaxID=1094489 RepID=M1NS35_BARAA|nr:DUF1561 family protein [Bartonella australis]AGF74153.1 hypothetical protein BAnh1_02700 [Bartonella australis AUST/NH1]
MRRSEVPLVDLDGCRLTAKTNLRFLLFFFVFLLSLHSLFAAPVPTPVPQKLTDTPSDQSIRVRVSGGKEYCYAPVFVRVGGYVYIDNCSSSKVQSGRYDVFQRIGWNIKNVWLCMTAPGSVTGIDGSGSANWDYIMLRPCVINDPNQRWIVQGRALYTADGKFRVKDYGWYAYISKNAGDYYDHTLDPSMDHWVGTIATPGNMSFKTSVGWKFVTSSGFDMYYISDNGSKSDVFDLYYNPENGHIARYFPTSGLLTCMSSEQSPSEDWNWVEWRFCYDVVFKEKHRGSWDVSFLFGREGPIFDRYGNILRITQYGPNWGRPYTAKPDYVKQDTANSPKSEFVLSYDIERWNRYVMANAEEALTYCPAPGKEPSVSGPQKRVKWTLPPDFELTEEWKRRLYAIATSTDGSWVLVGMCGTCFLQTLQMIAELQEGYPGSPRTSGGYFFDTAPDTNPFISLRRRSRQLYRELQLSVIVDGVLLTQADDLVTALARSAATVTQAALPNFTWSLSAIAIGQTAIHSAIRGLLRAPAGTIWVALAFYTLPDGRRVGHAVPILRSSGGLIVIPANLPTYTTSFQDFSLELSPLIDSDAILRQIAHQEGVTYDALATVQLTGVASRPLSVTISQNNCTGEGEGRRGSGREPRSSLLNQCMSGRCTLL